MRRITTGIVGGPILGQLSAFDSAVSGVVPNANISLAPNGTGEVFIESHVQIRANETIKLMDSDNSNFVGLKSPSTVASDITYTFPGTITDGYVLKTNATGELSWTEPSITITNQGADTATYYPAITTATSGTVTGVSTASSKLSFQPSSGNLTITGRLGGASASFTGNMSAATITETSSVMLKENISPIENALESIVQLAGKIYDRKDGSSKNEAGLIAEEVNEIIPNVVKKDESGNPESIHYSRLSAYLIEAVKSIKTEIDLLKKVK